MKIMYSTGVKKMKRKLFRVKNSRNKKTAPHIKSFKILHNQTIQIRKYLHLSAKWRKTRKAGLCQWGFDLLKFVLQAHGFGGFFGGSTMPLQQQ